MKERGVGVGRKREGGGGGAMEDSLYFGIYVYIYLIGDSSGQGKMLFYHVWWCGQMSPCSFIAKQSNNNKNPHKNKNKGQNFPRQTTAYW